MPRSIIRFLPKRSRSRWGLLNREGQGIVVFHRREMSFSLIHTAGDRKTQLKETGKHRFVEFRSAVNASITVSLKPLETSRWYQSAIPRRPPSHDHNYFYPLLIYLVVLT